jgi:ribose 5-phosphate isomerase RpiB
MSDAAAVDAMKKWLSTDFEGGRHQRRVEKIESEVAK